MSRLGLLLLLWLGGHRRLCLRLLRFRLLLLLLKIEDRLLLRVERLLLRLLLGWVGRHGLIGLVLFVQGGHVLSTAQLLSREARLETGELLLGVLRGLRRLRRRRVVLVRGDRGLQILALNNLELLLALQRLRLGSLRLLQPLVLRARLGRLQVGGGGRRVTRTGGLVVSQARVVAHLEAGRLGRRLLRLLREVVLLRLLLELLRLLRLGRGLRGLLGQGLV